MTIEFLLTEQAAAEYEAIVLYLCDSLQSPQAAQHFESEFLRLVELASTQPELFPLSRHPRLAELGYRILLVNRYIALYTYRDKQVVIAHIFHQTQDYSRLV